MIFLSFIKKERFYFTFTLGGEKVMVSVTKYYEGERKEIKIHDFNERIFLMTLKLLNRTS